MWRKALKIIQRAIFEGINRVLPVKKNTAFFMATGEHYADNPKYVSEKLHDLEPAVQIYWMLAKDNNEAIPEYVKPIYCDNSYSWACAKWSHRAQIVVNNGAGQLGYAKMPRFSRFLLERKGQIIICTWHGTPLKKIGGSEQSTTEFARANFQNYATFILAGCQYNKEIFQKDLYLRGKVPVCLTGTPRNDVLVLPDSDRAARLKTKLKLPTEKKIVLFAPTFRKNTAQNGGVQLEQIDVSAWLDALSARFGGEWVLAVRFHAFVNKSLNIAEFIEKYPGKVVSGNLGSDMAEYLQCVDALITDYSSSMFDFVFTEKPCFLYAYDLEEYKQERGVYLNIEELPFPLAATSSELVDRIKSFDAIKYSKDVEKMLHDLGNVEDGHAAERVVESILHFIKTGEKKPPREAPLQQ